MLCAGSISRDVENRKQRHVPLKFAEFPNQSPSTNYVTTLQHHNFRKLFSISPTTNNWTLDIFRILFEPYHTCKSDRKQLRKNSPKLRVWVHVRRSVSFFHSFNCSNVRSATILAPFWLNSESHVINMLFSNLCVFFQLLPFHCESLSP